MACKGHLSTTNQCLCDDCINELPWLTHQCSRCALPLLEHSKPVICPDCQKKPPPFRRCVAAFHYQNPVDKLIAGIKTNPHAPELLQLSGLLATTIADSYQNLDMPQLIIPLPLHWRKLTRRGFNQSYSIAKLLCEQLPGTELSNDICYRRTHSKPQHLQSKPQRLRLMRNAFAVSNRVDGLTVAIVDDVVTTKATAMAAASSLLKAGANSVDIWCIARTGWHIAAP